MKLHLRPTELPFFVGDTVLVNQPYDKSIHNQPTFQGKIIQIILDGNLNSTSVIRERKDEHLIEITNAVYDIKPSGPHADLPRILVEVDLRQTQYVLFANQDELKAYENRSFEVSPSI